MWVWMWLSLGTVLNISKLKKLTATAPQPFYNVLLFFRTLCIVWNLVRRKVTRRLTRLQTMYNVLKYHKIRWNNDKISIDRNRNGTGFSIHLIMTSTVPRMQFWFPMHQIRRKILTFLKEVGPFLQPRPMI